MTELRNVEADLARFRARILVASVLVVLCLNRQYIRRHHRHRYLQLRCLLLQNHLLQLFDFHHFHH